MNFKQWLELDLSNSSQHWLDPDQSYRQKELGHHNTHYVTFIYTDEHKLYLGDQEHYMLMSKNPELRQRYEGRIEREPVMKEFDDLFGRVGDYKDRSAKQFGGELVKIISFWNDKKESYDKLMAPCINQLMIQHVVDKNDPQLVVSTPYGTHTISDQLNSKPVLSPAEIQAMQQKLHVMPPMQKKDAMRQLGMVGSMKKSPWQSNMEKEKVIGPGQRWWAQTSETNLRK